MAAALSSADSDSVIKIIDTLYHDRHFARFFVLETIARVPYFEVRLVEKSILSESPFRGELERDAPFAYHGNHFSECIESHAFSAYDEFIKDQGDELKMLPAPEVAVKDYTGDDLSLLDEFQTSRPPNSRRPTIESLYDVFANIRDDEAEHCKTMRTCQTHGNLRSPHTCVAEDEPECILPEVDCEGIVDCIKKFVSSPQTQPKKRMDWLVHGQGW